MYSRDLKAALLLATAMITTPALAGKMESGGPATKSGTAAERAQAKILFGDLHMHTAYSFDAYLFKTTATPDDAYRFAQGQPLAHPGGGTWAIDRPLDFLAVTDHSEYMGVVAQMGDPKSPMFNSTLAKQSRDPDPKVATEAFRSIIAAMKADNLESIFSPKESQSTVKSTWGEVVKAANRHYRPGRFTTFIGYEWSAAPQGQNMHRNVIFRGAAAPQPFSSVDSSKAGDLWNWLDATRAKGYNLLAIPHNSNMSDGLMFIDRDDKGNPYTAALAAQRMRNEPVVEITQLKGTSETHPLLSPNDEFAGFEIVEQRVGQPVTITKFKGGYVRDALRTGLELQDSKGFNPFRLGIVGASDTHAAGTPTRQDQFKGGHGVGDMNAKARLDCVMCPGTNDLRKFGAMGLTAVFARSNTREAIYDAIAAKETYATNGPRMLVRFFAGWNLKSIIPGKGKWVEEAYSRAVPMGGALKKGKGSPQFLVWAQKDPMGANLDRIQIIKVWSRNGQSQEQVYDVALSGGRKVDARTGKAPAVGNTVDVKNATYSNSIGAVELKATWTDPAFDAKAPAAYYARVLEIPTPRWSTYDAKELGREVPADLPGSIQSRAFTSPIWYDR